MNYKFEKISYNPYYTHLYTVIEFSRFLNQNKISLAEALDICQGLQEEIKARIDAGANPDSIMDAMNHCDGIC